MPYCDLKFPLDTIVSGRESRLLVNLASLGVSVRQSGMIMHGSEIQRPVGARDVHVLHGVSASSVADRVARLCELKYISVLN